MANKDKVVRITPKEAENMRAGIWAFIYEGKEETAIYLADLMQQEDGHRLMYFVDNLGYLDDHNGNMNCHEVEQLCIDQGRDITEEFLSDINRTINLITFAPYWMDKVLRDRPDIRLSKELLKTMNQSNDRQVRLLSIKHLSRVTKMGGTGVNYK